MPKCIVHGAGGTLLQHLKEHLLHGDLKRGDRLFYFTTCGWMMWNWLVSGLAARRDAAACSTARRSSIAGARSGIFAEEERMTHFGTSAKYIDAAKKLGVVPRKDFELTHLRTMFSTGSPLAAGELRLRLPVRQGRSLPVVDLRRHRHRLVLRARQPDAARVARRAAVPRARPGGRRLRRRRQADPGRHPACAASSSARRRFRRCRCGFWNDPDGAKYRAAYFERFPGVWCHGDYVELTEHDGLVIHGRSDATLNPGGVRIGTAEIYRQVEQLPEVVESLVIGQDWPPGEVGDVRVVLFVKLREGVTLDEALSERIRAHIRANTTPRHVPAQGRAGDRHPAHEEQQDRRARGARRRARAAREELEALANPEALEQYRDRPELHD